MANYEVIDLTQQFDLQFYRDIGLTLDPLEDASSNGPIPCLNRAAQMWDSFSKPGAPASNEKIERARQFLHAKHSQARALMDRAQEGLQYDSIDLDHPAIAVWEERSNGLLLPEDHLKNIGLVRLTFVRDTGEDEVEPDFVTITQGKADHYLSPLDVASQLATARVALIHTGE